MANVQHIFKSTSAPSLAPIAAGHHFINTTTGDIYLSKGTASVADWVQVGGGGGTWGSITGTLSDQTDLQTALNAKQAAITGANAKFVRKDASGVVVSDETFASTDEGELFQQPTFSIADGAGKTALQIAPTYTLTEDSPTTTVTTFYVSPNVTDNGFELGRPGNAINLLSTNYVHNSATDIGGINLLTQNFSIGNGTDPVSIKGVGYAFGFGNFNANVTIDGPVQGYGFQPNFHASSIMTDYITAFYDVAQVNTKANGYQSLNLSPLLAEIANNNNATFINLNPTISSFEGNASSNGISIAGTWENFDTGGVNFINVYPTADDQTGRYANGLWVDMANVDLYPGLQSSVVIQDLTLTFNQVGDNDNYSVQYLSGGTAGSETVSLNGQNIEITLESGVSTATQVKAAIDGTGGINTVITVTISGTASNPQTTAGPISFTGGENAGNKLAAYFGGNVQITGSLSFGGALSIGQLSAFATQPLVNGGGTPSSIHSLITAPTVAANATLTTGDTISVNTAALINIGANASVSTAFIGVAALGLPAVLTMGAGSTLDRCYGALFALSLDAAAGGGTVDEVGLCRSVAIPNGVTTVNNLYGYLFDLPFGDPGTKTFGFYDKPGKNNYFAGTLLIGGTPSSDDTVTNSSVALEIKSTTKALVVSRMDSTAEGALTAINGMIIYNTTTNKFRGYAGGSWVDLH